MMGCVLLFLAVGWAGADLASERTANTVEIKMYPLSETEWPDKTPLFAAEIATAASTYCTTNPGECGSVTAFSTSDVGVSSVEDYSKSMYVNFYVDIPSAASSPFVLPTAAIEAITKSARDAIKTSTDAYVTYIEETYFGIPVDETTNSVIIPIAFLIVVAVAIITIGLVKWEAKKAREEKMLKREELRKSKREQKPKEEVVTPKLNGNKVRPKEFSTRRQQPVVAANRLPHVVLDEQRQETPREDDIQVQYTNVPSETPAERTIPVQYTNGTTRTAPNDWQPTTQPPAYAPATDNVAMETEAERMERKRKKKEARRAERERKRIAEEMARQRGDSDLGSDLSGPVINAETQQVGFV